MKITLTEEIEIKSTDKTLRDKITQTNKQATNILETLIHIVEQEYDNIKDYEYTTQARSHIERLIHATKKNPSPKYANEYDTLYARTPSYLRRNLITKAINILKLHKANHDAWEKDKTKGKEPRLQYRHNITITFYRENMWKDDDKTCMKHATIKLYDGKTWDWIIISLKSTDAKYVHAARQAGHLGCPSIRVLGNKKVFLDFPITYTAELHDTPAGKERICAIDLGITTPATCVIMEPDGTVLARRFLKLVSEKAHLDALFGRLRKAQSKGSRKLSRKWRAVNSANEEIVRKTVRGIVDFAVEYSAETIVCEFLDIRGKLKGKGKWKLQLWRKREMYHRLVNQAHVWDMRVRQVCAWGTSKLAHDGSGAVERGHHICDSDGVSLGFGFSWVRFSNGKLYNADLNAALNIGARYFVRECLKSLPVKAGSYAQANVLGGMGGSAWTLSSLISLRRALDDGHVIEAVTG